MRRVARRTLGRLGYAVINTNEFYSRDGLYTLHNDHFRRDREFLAAYARGIKAGHGVDPKFEWRVHIALWAAMIAARVPGDFVECGVNAGFMSSAIMQRLNWANVQKRFFLVDTFSGPVLERLSSVERKNAERAIAAGAYVTDLERIRANYVEWPNAVIIQGAVPDVLPSLDCQAIALLHIDLNCASAERDALLFFWKRLSPGAIVLFDDYVFTGQPGQTAAIDAAAREVGAQVLSLPTGQGLIVR